MKIGNIILLVAIILGTAFLSGLGTWQLKRLAWKEGLVERVEQNLEKPALDISSIETLLAEGQDIEYRPVWVSGTFDHGREQHYFATHRGQPGYFVYTPLTRSDGRVVFINRGYVPLSVKGDANRQDGQVSGQVRITGLARTAPTEKPNRFVPENDLQKNVYHWKSLAEMTTQAYRQNSPAMTGFFIDADGSPNPGGLPLGGVTRIKFSNSHLQYALTWFGLAGALVIVGGYFLFGRLKSNRALEI